MDRTEFYNWFVENVRPRWPRWQVSRVMLEDWYSAFAGFEPGELTAAAARHKIYDDPYRPSTKRLLEIIKSRRPVSPPPRPEQSCENLMPIAEIEANLPGLYSKDERIELITNMAKFRPAKAKHLDSRAYQWALEAGAISDD